MNANNMYAVEAWKLIGMASMLRDVLSYYEATALYDINHNPDYKRKQRKQLDKRLREQVAEYRAIMNAICSPLGVG